MAMKVRVLVNSLGQAPSVTCSLTTRVAELRSSEAFVFKVSILNKSKGQFKVYRLANLRTEGVVRYVDCLEFDQSSACCQ